MQSTAHTYVRRALIALITISMLAVGVHTYAQERTETTSRPQLSERLQERIVNLASNVSNRTNAAIARLENISGRINSRMAKLEAQGYNTVLVKERHGEAIEALAQAKQLNTTLASAQNALSSDNPKESFNSIISTFQETRRALTNAHQAFTDTINLMRELSTEQVTE